MELDGKQLPIWDSAEMNEFQFREVSIIPQYAMSALNPTRKIGTMTRELLESRHVHFKTVLPELKGVSSWWGCRQTCSSAIRSSCRAG